MVKARNNHTPQALRWYNRHYWSMGLAFVSLVAAYIIGSRSLDTGSWQEYIMTFVLLVFGLNRLGNTAHTTAKTLWAMLPKNRK
ncbi:MAG TPA: hypothetical protein VLG47_01910 [Candidatus Saccharimonadales bacterium]|nr:hypothetical protein [Candidatus Saccharimonadales bacterium]